LPTATDLIADLRAAVATLTVLAFGGPPTGARAVWVFPVVGIGVGAASGAVAWLAEFGGAPPLVGAVCALAAGAVLTGGLHEDGLADVADGFAAPGRARARVLEIMRDSRIGAFGALALVLSCLLRAAAVAANPHPLAALAVAGGFSRAAMAVLAFALPPARADGLAAGLGRPGRWPTAVAVGIALGTAGSLLPEHAVERAQLTAALATLVVGWLAWRRIGGATGDVYGAAEQVTSCAVLAVLSVP
jgi:adenosylcobinamide-GDP ribazoletransferase